MSEDVQEQFGDSDGGYARDHEPYKRLASDVEHGRQLERERIADWLTAWADEEPVSRRNILKSYARDIRKGDTELPDA